MLKVRSSYFSPEDYQKMLAESLTDEQIKFFKEAQNTSGVSYTVEKFIDEFNAKGKKSNKIREAFGVDDFGALMADRLNRSIKDGFEQFPAHWSNFVSTNRSVNDLERSINPIFHGSFGEFQQTPAGAASEFDTFSVEDFQYTPSKYTKEFGLTMEAQLADDLGGLNDVGMRFGSAGTLTLNAFVIRDLIDSSPSEAYPGTGGSSTSLFDDATFGNYLGNSTPLSINNIKDAMQKMLEQTDLDGNPVNPQPQFLLVHRKNEIDARNLLATNEMLAHGSSDNNDLPRRNPVQGALEVIPTPHIGESGSGSQTDAWYVVASPNTADVVEMAFLNGVQEPITMIEPQDSGQSFDRMIRRWKSWLAFGGVALNPKAFVGANRA